MSGFAIFIHELMFVIFEVTVLLLLDVLNDTLQEIKKQLENMEMFQRLKITDRYKEKLNNLFTIVKNLKLGNNPEIRKIRLLHNECTTIG